MLKRILLISGLLLSAGGVVCVVYSNNRKNQLLDTKIEYPLTATMPLPPDSGCPTCDVHPEIRTVGSIEVDWPKTIKPGASKTILLTLHLSKEQLEEGQICSCVQNPEEYLNKIKYDLSLSPPKVVSENRFFGWGDHWAAYLSSTTFDVSTSSPELQSFDVEKAEWRWNISPKQSAEGKQVINVAVHAEYSLAKESKGAQDKNELQSVASLRNRKPKAGAVNPEKSDPVTAPAAKTYVYPIYIQDLPIDINQGWINWTFVKLGGFLTIITGAGITFPYFREWLKETRVRRKTVKKIGFRK